MMFCNFGAFSPTDEQYLFTEACGRAQPVGKRRAGLVRRRRLTGVKSGRDLPPINYFAPETRERVLRDSGRSSGACIGGKSAHTACTRHNRLFTKSHMGPKSLFIFALEHIFTTISENHAYNYWVTIMAFSRGERVCRDDKDLGSSERWNGAFRCVDAGR